MLFDDVRHQLDFLSEGNREQATLALTQAFELAQAALPEHLAVAPGTLNAVGRDLIYALLRHTHWHSVPLFRDIMVDHVASGYQVPRAAATSLIDALFAASPTVDDGTDKANRADGASHVVATNEEFIRYVCVASATATSEAILVRELGLGLNLLGRIKHAVSQLVQIAPDEGAPAVARFLPEIDAQVAEALCELARELRTLPWALQIHFLRFHLIGIGEPWRDVLKERGARWLFDLLLAIGARETMSVRQVAAKLARLVPEPCLSGGEALALALLENLHAYDLVFRTGDGNRREPAQARWALLPLAQELTAEAYARSRAHARSLARKAQEGTSYNWSEIATLSPYYQAAVIRALPDDDVQHLGDFILRLRPLAALGLRAALLRLIEADLIGVARGAAEELLTAEPSPWVRQAACQALVGLSETLQVGQTLSEVARSDASSAVRAEALRASLRVTLRGPAITRGATASG